MNLLLVYVFLELPSFALFRNIKSFIIYVENNQKKILMYEGQKKSWISHYNNLFSHISYPIPERIRFIRQCIHKVNHSFHKGLSSTYVFMSLQARHCFNENENLKA